MVSILSAAALAASFAARHPRIAHAGILPDISASADTVDVSASAGTVDGIDAMAIRGFSAPSSKLVWVKALSHFLVGGELVKAGDFIEIEESDAKRMERNEQVEPATQADVDAAALGSKTKVSA